MAAASPSGPGRRRLMGFLARTWVLELRQLIRTKLYVYAAALVPLVLASIAHLMFANSLRNVSAMEIALSSGLMGMWATTLLGSGTAITRLRYMSLLEPLVASPTPTRLFIAPYALATSSLGLVSVVCTLGWSAMVFDAPVVPSHPVHFVIAMASTTLAMGMLAQMMASFFILVPNAQPLTNLLEYPAWILSGLLVPLSVLPGPLQAAAWALAPTWAVRAVRSAAEGHGRFWYPVVASVALSLVYWLLSALMLSRFERIARQRGTLVLQ